MRFSNPSRTIIFILVALIVAGCAGLTPPPAFPTEPNALQHYNFGQRFLDGQHYDMAAAEFERSLEFESVAYITHSKLAVAYFVQQKFADAARQFEATYRLWGGPSNGPAWAIMQAVSLQRAGKEDEVERLLQHWTGPGIVPSGVGTFITVGEPLPGPSKLLARYLLGAVDENSVLDQAPAYFLPFAYLVIGISNATKGDTERARKFLKLFATATTTPTSGWTFALARAEMRNLK